MEDIQHKLNSGSDQLCILHGSKLYVKINTNCLIDECSLTSGWKYINIFNSLNINIKYGLYQDWAAGPSMEGMFHDRSQELLVSITDQQIMRNELQ
jgi:hypothetical protein